MSILKKAIDFLRIDIWRISTRKLSPKRSFWIRQLRIVLLAVRGFAEDKCQLRASALTFYSLLSIVPLAAMAFGIAKGFGFEKMLEQQLLDKVPGQEAVIQQVIGFAHSFLDNTKGGLIAGIGVAVLFWTVIKVLGNIENSFNDIWGIKKARGLGRKFSDYLSIMLICPILLIMSSSLTVMISSQVKLIMERIAILGAVSPLILLLLKLLPFCVMWVLFVFIYVFMPNTKVKFRSALWGGVIAGTIYQVVQWIYITFQLGAAKFGAIYGSFAALPLFLVWMQTSWLIVLLGAEISFAEQNVETYEFEPDCLKASHCFKRLLALRVCTLCVKNFCAGRPARTAGEISHELEVPIRLVNQILFELVNAVLLSEVRIGVRTEVGYQPARDAQNLTVQSVLSELDCRGVDTIPVAESSELKKLRECLAGFEDAIQKSSGNLYLKDI